MTRGEEQTSTSITVSQHPYHSDGASFAKAYIPEQYAAKALSVFVGDDQHEMESQPWKVKVPYLREWLGNNGYALRIDCHRAGWRHPSTSSTSSRRAHLISPHMAGCSRGRTVICSTEPCPGHTSWTEPRNGTGLFARRYSCCFPFQSGPPLCCACTSDDEYEHLSCLNVSSCSSAIAVTINKSSLARVRYDSCVGSESLLPNGILQR